MPKLYCVIGRSPINYKKRGRVLGVKVVWHVDLDLGGYVRRVSRQHALVAFNFERELFEIKCLSRKYPIRVNGKSVSFTDPPTPIKSGSIICVGRESFFFMLPASDQSTPNSKQ